MALRSGQPPTANGSAQSPSQTLLLLLSCGRFVACINSSSSKIRQGCSEGTAATGACCSGAAPLLSLLFSNSKKSLGTATVPVFPSRLGTDTRTSLQLGVQSGCGGLRSAAPFQQLSERSGCGPWSRGSRRYSLHLHRRLRARCALVLSGSCRCCCLSLQSWGCLQRPA